MAQMLVRGRTWAQRGVFALCAFVSCSIPAVASQATAPAPECQAGASLVRVANLPEGSGLAASRRVPGRFWALNDSGEPVIIALDSRGVVTTTARIPGAKVEDWEAVAVGPCAAGSCVYVADIGDNDARRKQITIYRLTEPGSTQGSAGTSEALHATYPDGAHDAETLLVDPDGRLYIVTKGDTGPVAIYRFPLEMRAGASVRLEKIGNPRETGQPGNDARITDGAVSPNGEWVALRTTRGVTFYRSTDLLKGTWREARRVDLTPLGETQGEGLAFGDDSALYVVGEGGGKSQPGTFARVTCSP